jgi:large subunit ribosomal protein L3
MFKFIIGTKDGMTQVFDETGACRAATVLRVPPIRITQLRSKESDGYQAVQLGVGTQKEHRANKAEKGHFKTPVAFAREFRLRDGADLSSLVLGAVVDVSVFSPGDTVTVSAFSKGKGFQGVVKRHGFGGGRRSHGQKHSEREPGSIGGGGRAGGRVIKGMRMAGRMGNERVTVKNLTVLQVDPKGSAILISGAIPGRRGSVVEVRGR